MDRIVEALARDSRIAFALLFGSAARGDSHAGSDLDIAIGLVLGARWSAHEDEVPLLVADRRRMVDQKTRAILDYLDFRPLESLAATGIGLKPRWRDIASTRHVQADPRVRFLGEPRGLAPIWITLSKREDGRHLLWTDDYLAAFAQAADVELVTLDRGFDARYPSVRTTLIAD